ncbi:hypothetical protein M406DRAFT_329799 [Cryphonectria parasitica EP155]|uniref:Orc1-like AAA ATPase domain-containing protein n=1 Tax=Cryphonectria parasitica (strain ATCC 38755 / EP155) TaxID=660469 RepID=A0A9P4Y2U8_CRYP1|nr:uncharacterized protein M406DRAFT_329799 [Cryphonectria parasitica EP155]KAF3765954.1 hypothetical protein M406DRAFT_329799 [Cryphonectria parasitica EP155]
MAASMNMSQLPDELVLSILNDKFPCRETQTRALAVFFDPRAASCRNCIVYGTEATGKSAIVSALLQELAQAHRNVNDDDDSEAEFQYAIVSSPECVTGRHLLETTVRKVAGAVGFGSFAPRCENLAQLTFELSKMLKFAPQPKGRHFVLVFDGIDRQKEAPPTLLPALARLSGIIPHLTTVFIVTNPPPNALLTTFVNHVHFPNYDKAEFVKILSTTPPPALANATAAETTELWKRFCGAVHDALTRSAARTLPALQLACNSLWRRFTAPIREGNLGPKDFSKLLIAARRHFQDESLLDPGIVRRRDKDKDTAVPQSAAAAAAISRTSLAALLPLTARILLIAAYLASHNAARHDLSLFSTYYHGRRKRRGGGAGARAGGPRNKHRKIARKLLGAHAFVLERMMAIFAAVRNEWGIGGSVSGTDADVGMALATLASLRLLVRVGVGGGDPLDRGGKWRVNVGWEIVRSLGRSMGVEVEEWLIE